LFAAGLRTLCFGYRELSNDEVEQFLIDYRTASMSILDRQPRLDALADQYECDLHFLGISAIEDRLQEVYYDSFSLLEFQFIDFSF
jgi:magnesium-transporting ATPase (P-type)